MSKSYGNAIAFGAGPEEMKDRVRLMVTDPQRIKRTDKGNPDVCTVFTFHKVFNTENSEDIACKCRAAEIGCVQCKNCLAERMNDILADIHIRREELKNKPNYVREVLEFGAERARKVAAANMEEIRAAMNVL